MKRRVPLVLSQPLQRRTPLISSPSMLRSSTLRSGSGLRAVSRKRARENRQRREVVAAIAEEQQWCSRCGASGVVIDPDERLSRARGGSITDPANIQLLCRPCHDWKHGNDEAAQAEGWSESQYRGGAA